ncbi:hypothetical protein ACTFOZ_04785 [Bacillus cereus group sp. MYBK71-2]|uniref:hypothetical protein n=1 Tax=Bacillus cereus group sp. MYBK71-2 TaxID=3450611 RepID=UPI003F7A1F95
MGCDIHAYVEVKRYPYQDEKRENGVWINADKWTVNQEYALHPEDDQRHMIIDYDDYIYKGRNYYLFICNPSQCKEWKRIYTNK